MYTRIMKLIQAPPKDTAPMAGFVGKALASPLQLERIGPPQAVGARANIWPTAGLKIVQNRKREKASDTPRSYYPLQPTQPGEDLAHP